MIKGTGNIILGDLDFSTEIVKLCNFSFTLEQVYQSWGYEYLNSTAKMLTPAIDSYDAKSKEWTITMDVSSLPQVTLDLLKGPRIQELLDREYETFTCRNSDVPDTSIYSEVYYYNNTQEKPIPSLFSEPDDLMTVLAFTGNDRLLELNQISNRVLSFSGLIFGLDGRTSVLQAPEVQVESLPALGLNNQTIKLRVLKGLQIFRPSFVSSNGGLDPGDSFPGGLQ